MYTISWYFGTVDTYASLDEACVHFYRYYCATGRSFDAENVKAWRGQGCCLKKDGKELSSMEMLSHGKKLLPLWNSYEFWNAGLWRQGPVKGVRKWRGGPGYYRRVKTMQERRLNLSAMTDEGVVHVRGKRRNLPSTWDDFCRTQQHTWKEQFRGRKSWDRP